MVFKKIKDFFSGKAEEKPEAREITPDELEKEINSRKEEIKSGVEANTGDSLKVIRDTQEKIGRLIDNLEDAETTEEVHPRIYKSGMEEKRLLVKKTRRALGKLRLPTSQNWGKLNDFSQSLARSINLLGEASASHRLRVATLFEDRMNKFGKLLDRLRDAGRDFDAILSNASDRISELDELSTILKEREDTLNRVTALRKRIESLERRINERQETFEKTEDSLESLKKSKQFKTLEEEKQDRKQIKSRLKSVRNSIKSSVSGISRPLRKMKKMIQREEYATSYDVLNALNSYLDNPFQAAKSEEEGLPKFRTMLKELRELMKSEMKLSDRERRKKLAAVDKLLKENTVSRLLSEYVEKKAELERLREKRRESPLLERKRKLEKTLRNTRSDLESTKKDLDEAKERLIKTQENIAKETRNLKEAVKSLFNAEIKNPD